MFATSCPCAVTTSGARSASAPIRPVGNRKWAWTTSGARPRRCDSASRQRGPASPAPRPRVQDGEVDVVSPGAQRVDHLCHERAEIRVPRPRIHLRDDEDAHGAYDRCLAPRLGVASVVCCRTRRAGCRRSRRSCSGRASASRIGGSRFSRPPRRAAPPRARPRPPARRARHVRAPSARAAAARPPGRAGGAGSARSRPRRSGSRRRSRAHRTRPRPRSGTPPPRSPAGRTPARSRRRRRPARRPARSTRAHAPPARPSGPR